MYARMHAYVNIRINAGVYACKYVLMHICTYVYLRACMCLCMYVFMCVSYMYLSV